MRRAIWISAIAIIATSLFVSVRSFHAARISRALTTKLNIQGSRLSEQIVSARNQLAASTPKLELSPLAEVQKEKPTPQATPATSQARRDLANLMESSPALRTLFQQSFRAGLGLRFRPFYDVAQLSPEQIDKFEELMTEAEQDNLDLRASAKTQGLAASDPALKKMWQQHDEKLQSRQKEILGGAGYPELQRYNRQESLLYFTTTLAALTSDTSTPLTASQGGELLNILSNASPPYRNGGKADMAIIDLPFALTQAKQVLSPNQYAALEANFRGLELLKLKDQFYQQKKAAK